MLLGSFTFLRIPKAHSIPELPRKSSVFRELKPWTQFCLFGSTRFDLADKRLETHSLSMRKGDNQAVSLRHPVRSSRKFHQDLVSVP